MVPTVSREAASLLCALPSVACP